MERRSRGDVIGDRAVSVATVKCAGRCREVVSQPRRHGSDPSARDRRRSSSPASAASAVAVLRHHPAQPIQPAQRRRSRRLRRQRLEAELGVSPRYILQTGSRGPWTFGFLGRPSRCPSDSMRSSLQFQRAVICHELLHIKRRDIAVAFVEELAVAALWFHPWIWLLRARIRVAREQVVDSRVVDDARQSRRVRALSRRSCPATISRRTFRRRAQGCCARASCARGSMPCFRRCTCRASRFAVAAVCVRRRRLIATRTRLPFAAMPLPSVRRAQIAGARPRSASRAGRSTGSIRSIPQDALERGIKGVVIVDITVNAAGDVTTAAVASGPRNCVRRLQGRARH